MIRKSLQNNLGVVQRMIYVLIASVLLMAGLPLMSFGRADAAQMTSRSIQMSDSAASGAGQSPTIASGVGSGTSVTYKVSFTTAAAADSMVIDFCAEDPLINNTCTAPTGMTAATGFTGVTGNITSTSGAWTLTAAAGQAKLAKNTGSTASAGAQSFELTGITNPSTVGTFYARMYTYTNATWGTYSAANSVGNYVDYGGIALSTTSTIQITAKVQESLTFCITKDDPTGTALINGNANGGTSAATAWVECSDAPVAANPPLVTLGHNSPNAILDAQQVDTANIYTQISTNATSGAVVNMRNSNTSCGGLSADNGATCAIPAINSGGNTPALPAAGTASFGLFVSDSATNTAGVGTVTPDARFNDGTHENLAAPLTIYYGMDTTTSNDNVQSTYGAKIASSTGPVYRVYNNLVFSATAAAATPAGIYTANLSLIATGTF